MYLTGSYITGTTIVYRLDPRIKLATVIVLSIVILAAKPMPLFFLGLILFFLAFFNNINLRAIGQAFKPLLFFIVLIFLVHALFTGGESYLSIPYLGLSLSRTGLTTGFLVTWQFLCLIWTAVLLTMTTQPAQIIAAIKYYLHPLKLLHVPVDVLAVMIMLALRMMPVLLAEKERIEIARRARGYNWKKSGFSLRIKVFLSLTAAVLIGVFRKTDELAVAMEARNFSFSTRSSFVELRMTSADFIAIILLSILALIFMALNFCFS
jgi:energy-coupling factor transporter transmembrane protein EcfT